MQLNILVATTCLLLACWLPTLTQAQESAKSRDRSEEDLAEIVDTLRQAVPFDNEVIPAGETYLRVLQSAVTALYASDKLKRHRIEHERKWNAAREKHATAAVPTTGSAFNCDVVRSHSPPTSVDKLRPADIDVVGAIGDSLTAGMGIYSKNLLTIFTQYRGHSFTMGGKEDLSQHTTMPTVLKKFNPKLTGFSTGISGPDGIFAGFNEAVVGNRAEDMPRQARQLVEKMKKDKKVAFETDWKLINLFIGGNDVCDHCKDPSRFSVENYEKHIRTALDYLYDNVPRAFVNLIEMMDVAAVNDLKDQSLVCKALLQTFWCKCGSTLSKEEVYEYSMELQRRARRIAEDPKWTRKSDFTVVLQPFLREITPPTLPNGEPDMAYFAPDCFHLSDKGHALGGLALWNTMLEPVGKKRTDWVLNDRVNCPTEQRPYLATKGNSGSQ
uniref:Phospholipase B1, membrane-associated n=2 Tax=Macrostomum lignano TaxID=282301 RepID=A0A1I8HC09_9PLAT